MPRRLLTAALLASAGIPAGVNAQDSTRSARRSVVGSTRLGLDASYGKPAYSVFSGTASVAPFLSEHWQIGLSPTWEIAGGVRNYYYSGVAEAVVNYVWLDERGSGPYLGGFASQRGATFARGYGVYGVQAGWLRFLSPSVALRGEVRLRRYNVDDSPLSVDWILALDPYVLGQARRSLTTLPGFGVFDATLLADYAIRPEHALSINTTLAPFLTRWLQTGASADVQFAFYRSSGTRQFELFARGYAPVDARLVPFADAFVGNASVGMSDEAYGSHGTRVGLRAYLAPGVALDVAAQWRRYDSMRIGTNISTPAPDRTLRVSLTTQFRAMRVRN